MLRIYKISTPGGHAMTDLLITRMGNYTLGGSGIVPGTLEAFVQVFAEGDDDAVQAAEDIVGPTGWTVTTGYGIHHRTVAVGTDELWASKRLAAQSPVGPVA